LGKVENQHGASEMVENALEITGLRKTYAGQGGQAPKEALKGVDLAIPKGSIFGLLGPNGAGKSTLINILAGLVVKSAGQVNIWGFDQDINPRQSRASIGVMPQELNMDPFFSPREALEVQAGLYGVPKSQRKSDEILEMIGLSDKADAYARTLSGGMRRRLLLGKALVHHPDILVLDEPTAGVDIEIRQMLWENVRKLNARGMTIILTTHYLEEAEEMCDEIGIINHGELIVREDTKTLVGRMDQKTLLITPERPITEFAAPDGTSVDLRRDGSIAIKYASKTTTANSILEALRTAEIIIKDVRTEEPDLEDAFLALTTDQQKP
jgi:ABC-2 type transport system ATP-binding protein